MHGGITTWFRVAALLEGFSWLGLLTGMYFKYLSDAGDVGVTVFGPVHGGLFLGYVVLTIAVACVHRWSKWVLLAGLLAAVPPFATWIFEWWAHRSGHLSERTSTVRPQGIERT